MQPAHLKCSGNPAFTACHLFLMLSNNKFCAVSAEAIAETDKEKIACLEALLLRDLQVLKHRQAIHPILQEGEFIQSTYTSILVVK